MQKRNYGWKKGVMYKFRKKISSKIYDQETGTIVEKAVRGERLETPKHRPEITLPQMCRPQQKFKGKFVP